MCVKLSLLCVRVYEYMSSPKLFYWVFKIMMGSANYCFRMHAYDWWRIRGATSGEDGRRSPLPFFEYWKKWPNIGKKNALIVFSHELNIHLCSHLKSCFKSTYEEKLQNFPLWRLTFMCCRWNVYRSALILTNLSCEIPVCTPAFCFHSWQINWLLNHVYTVPDRIFYRFKNLSDIVWSI